MTILAYAMGNLPENALFPQPQIISRTNEADSTALTTPVTDTFPTTTATLLCQRFVSGYNDNSQQQTN